MARIPLLRTALACALLAGSALPATPAGAADADVFRRGTRWCATTHPGHGTLEQDGGYGPALDLGAPSGGQDFRWPVHAPGNGRVRIYSRGWGDGWGNSIIWTSAGGHERIHMAHLDSFGRTGRVEAGDLIGRVGSTGQASGPHLHASAQRDGVAARLVLMGRVIRAGRCYTSTGPIPRYCFGRLATLIGTRRGERLVGTAGRDVIVARGGADRVVGGGGDDLICSGGGDDRVRSGQGRDRASGGAGSEVLVGGGGADRMLGEDGDDLLRGGSGADALRAGSGTDVLAGENGDDALDGGTGLDMATYGRAAAGVNASLAGGPASGDGADRLTEIEDLRGSRYPDVLTGDGGPNRLFGGADADILDGGEGQDHLDGGPGEDTCLGGETTASCP